MKAFCSEIWSGTYCVVSEPLHCCVLGRGFKINLHIPSQVFQGVSLHCYTLQLYTLQLGRVPLQVLFSLF